MILTSSAPYAKREILGNFDHLTCVSPSSIKESLISLGTAYKDIITNPNQWKLAILHSCLLSRANMHYSNFKPIFELNNSDFQLALGMIDYET